MYFTTLNKAIAFIRKRWFTLKKKDYDGIVVEASPDAVYRALVGERHYENAHKFSYNYKGEVHNIRRSEGFDDVNGEEKHMESHARFWPHPNGTFVQAHYEQDRFTHPDGHLDNEGLSWKRGQEILLTEIKKSTLPAEAKKAQPPWVDDDA